MIQIVMTLTLILLPDLTVGATGDFIMKWPEVQFKRPNGIAVDSGGNVFVADYWNHRIQVFDSSGTYLDQWGSSGNGNGYFNSPHGIAVDSGGNVFVADSGNNRIQLFEGVTNEPPEFELIIDNCDPETSYNGTWSYSSDPNYYGTRSWYSMTEGSTYRYEASLAGNYVLSLWWTEHPTRCTNTLVEVYDGTTLIDTLTVDQLSDGGQWNIQNSYNFSGTGSVEIVSQDSSCSINADAVRFIGAVYVPFDIDTTVGWNGVESVAPFGDGDAGESYGQTFIVPDGNPHLRSLSFWLEHAPLDTSHQPLHFSCFIMEWDTNRASGPILFESSLQTINSNQTSMTQFFFETNGLILQPGTKYIAFLNASNQFWDNNTTQVRVGFQNLDTYSDGEAWFQNTANDFNNVRTPWMNNYGSSDLVFQATFTPIP